MFCRGAQGTYHHCTITAPELNNQYGHETPQMIKRSPHKSDEPPQVTTALDLERVLLQSFGELKVRVSGL